MSDFKITVLLTECGFPVGRCASIDVTRADIDKPLDELTDRFIKPVLAAAISAWRRNLAVEEQ